MYLEHKEQLRPSVLILLLSFRKLNNLRKRGKLNAIKAVATEAVISEFRDTENGTGTSLRSRSPDCSSRAAHLKRQHRQQV